MTTVWIVAATAALLLASWPFGPFQLSLAIAKRLGRFPPAPDPSTTPVPASRETFAICLCAYNEAGVIDAKIQDLLRLREAAAGNLDIHIYVDAASDGTAAILEPYREQIDLVVSPERRGKTHGMNLLVSRTSASIVMFTDANVLIGRDGIEVLRRYFADRQIGCVCSDLSYVNSGASATANVGSKYWQFNEWTKGLETATGSVIGADGSLFAIRKSLHRRVPHGLFDDIFVSLAVLLQGYRVVRAPELKSFEMHTTEARDEFRRKVRIACECMHVHFTLWPDLRRLDLWHLYKYLANRMLRWIGPYLFLLAALFSFIASSSVVGFIPTLGFASGLALLFWGSLLGGFGPSARLWNIALAFIGNGVGVWRAFCGKRAITWNVPESARRTALHR